MSTTPSPRLMKGTLRVGIVAAVIAAVLVAWGIFSRIEARAELVKKAGEQSLQNVVIVKAKAGGASEELVLPGNVQAFTDTPIYARTSGYLKRWYVDIGTPVKAGQLLAEIDTPEVDQQLRQAEADLNSAEAKDKLTQSTSERWKGLIATDSVSRQEADEKSGDAAAQRAALASAQANLKRLRELQGFKRIVAPFDGVVTARNTDVGELIGVGNGGSNARELFHIASTQKLRIFVQVPQSYAASIKPGIAAELKVAEHPGQRFRAQVVRTANALDPNARTLLVELEFDNSKSELLPGAYAETHFKLQTPADILRLPANALLYRSEGLLVATVDAKSRIAMQAISVGRDFGKEIEVLSGIQAGQSIVINPPDSLSPGQTVKAIGAQETSGADKK